MSTKWVKQAPDTPVFPDIIWSQPENKALAGKLLVVGGNSHSFAAVGEAYTAAIGAGAGSVRVIFPNSLSKTVGQVFPEAEFAPSTPSGSFARTALAEFVAAGDWADAVVLAGDFGKNSETAILLESFIEKYSGNICIAQDSFDSLGERIASKPTTNLLLAPTFQQIQKFGTQLKLPDALTSDMGLVKFTETVSQISIRLSCKLITTYQESVVVAVGEKVSSTPVEPALAPTTLCTRAAVWLIQHPEHPFEAITSSIVTN